MSVIGEASVRIRPDTAGFAAGVQAGVGGSIKRIAGVAGLAVGFAGVTRVISGTINTAADYEQALANVGSVSNATTAQLERLGEQAQKLGPQFGIGAVAGVEAQEELAKAGLTTAQILGGAFKGTLALASAGSLNVSEAASIAANTLNLFGLEAKDVTAIADGLATAANATTADVADFGAALTQGGAVARQAGLSFQDTVVNLEALAAIGVKNSDAGTSMKAALLQLINPTKKQSALAKELGLSFTDQSGRIKDAAAISADLRREFGSLNEAQRTQRFAQLAGVDGFRLLAALYQAGPEQLRRYREGLLQTGTAAETTRKRQDTLRGDLNKLAAAYESAQIRIGRSSTGAAREGVQALTRLISGPDAERALNRTAQAIASTLTDPTIRSNAAALGGTISDVFGAIRQAAEVTGPVIRGVLQAIGDIASSPLGPGILAGAAAFKGLGLAVALATGALARYQAVAALARGTTVAQATAATRVVASQRAVAASTVATAVAQQRAAVVTATTSRAALTAQQLSQRTYLRTFATLDQATRSQLQYERTFATTTAAVTTGAGRQASGLARAAGAASTFGRSAARGIGALALGATGGPVGLAIAGTAVLAAGIATLAGKQDANERASLASAAALKTYADAARDAAAAVGAQQAVTDRIINANAGVTRSEQAVADARKAAAKVRAAPAADFGGEAQKAAAVKSAMNELAVAERAANVARQERARSTQAAVQADNAAAAKLREQAAAAREAVAATGLQSAAQSGLSIGLTGGTQQLQRYAAAQGNAVRAGLAASRGYTQSAQSLREQARSLDTTTASGKRQAAELRERAQVAQASAGRQRAAAIGAAREAIAANQRIANSARVSPAERAAARQRIGVIQDFANQIGRETPKVKGAADRLTNTAAKSLFAGTSKAKNAGAKIGAAAAEGVGSKAGEANAAGAKAGQAAAAGAAGQRGVAASAGQGIGAALIQGITSGIIAGASSAAAAAAASVARVVAAARAAARISSPSRVMAERVGKPLAEGIGAGMALAERGNDAAATRTVRRLTDAVVVRLNGGFRARISASVSRAVRDSISSAKVNLQSLGSGIADQLGQVIDRQLEAQTRAINAAVVRLEVTENATLQALSVRAGALAGRGLELDDRAAADEEARLRDAVRLAEAGQTRAQERLAAFEASLARRGTAADPLRAEQDRQRLEALRRAAADPAREQRLELERFLLQQDQTRLDRQRAIAEAEDQRERERVERVNTLAEQSAQLQVEAAEAAAAGRRQALDRGLADLVANLNAGRIEVKAFRRSVTQLIGQQGIEISALGTEFGVAFAQNFRAQLEGLLDQARELLGGPFTPGAPRPSIESPRNAARTDAAAVRAALRQAANAAIERRRQAFQDESSAGKGKITDGERAQLAALERLLNAIVNRPSEIVIEQLLAQSPGADPQAVADALIRKAAAAARR